MGNKVKFGLKNVHYAKITVGESNAVTFGTPVRIPGAVSMTMDAQGDQETFYADDIAYYQSYNNTGYQGTLEVALIPDSFRKDILGEQEDATDKVLVERSNAQSARFALLYQFAGDQSESLRVLYNCTASRPTEAGSTVSNTRTPTTETLNLTAAPMEDGLVKAKTTDTTPASVRAAWFTNVWTPTAEEGGET